MLPCVHECVTLSWRKREERKMMLTKEFLSLGGMFTDSFDFPTCSFFFFAG